MRQGGLSRQHYTVGEGKKKRQQGSFYILQGWRDGQHWSSRVSKDGVNQIREDVKVYERFQALCLKFAELTEKSTMKDESADSKKNDRRLSKKGFWLL